MLTLHGPRTIVPKELVERFIRTIKENVRAIASSLPFKKYPPRLIVHVKKEVIEDIIKKLISKFGQD